MKEITTETKMITLIGDPLAQSFAARMQNVGYESVGLNLLYFYTVAGNEHLEEIINGIRYMNFAGFAVTKPNKIKVLEFLDDLDPLCKMIGSCNTVVKTEKGKLIGYNTDALGFYVSFCEQYTEELGHTSVFCFGAGGVGRAISMVLAQHGVQHLYISDIDQDSGKKLVNSINSFFPEVAIFAEDTALLKQCQVVINASGIGMGSSVGKSPMKKEDILPSQFYFDACYNPEKTQFLLDAEEKGCHIMNGLDMSLYQGAAQIELWTEKEAPVEVMRNELNHIMEERKKSDQ